MDLLFQFKNFISKENLFSPDVCVLVAVSGGVDSVVLCELFHQAGFKFAIAHCNFNLRGADSDYDEIFVSQLAGKYAVPYFVETFDTEKFVSKKKLSVQAAARELRYHWFQTLLDNPAHHLRYLATAHHADDNVETIMMNFFKGAGISGLKGILPKHKNIIRPLLFSSKNDLLDFSSANGLLYREDVSNSSDKYTRNYFRNTLIPGMEKVFPQVVENLKDNALRFREINAIYEQAIINIKKGLMERNGEEVKIPVYKLLKQDQLTTIIYEIIKEFNFSTGQVSEIKKLLNAGSGKFCTSSTHRILKDRNWLIISPIDSAEANQYLVETTTQTIDFQKGKLIVAEGPQPGSLDAGNKIAYLDLKNVALPLLLRKWKKGDYFYPLGMKKKKKLSRFFSDNKLSLADKENVWVVESQKKILWVVGHRIDDRFKIIDSTNTVLRLELSPAK